MASLTIVLQSQHSVITAIICNWHLWQGEPSPSDECVLCVSMLHNRRKILGDPPAPHMWTVWHSSDFGAFQLPVSGALANTPIKYIPGKMQTPVMEYGRGSSRSESWLDWSYTNPLTCRLNPNMTQERLMQQVQEGKQFPLCSRSRRFNLARRRQKLSGRKKTTVLTEADNPLQRGFNV